MGVCKLTLEKKGEVAALAGGILIEFVDERESSGVLRLTENRMGVLAFFGGPEMKCAAEEMERRLGGLNHEH